MILGAKSGARKRKSAPRAAGCAESRRTGTESRPAAPPARKPPPRRPASRRPPARAYVVEVVAGTVVDVVVVVGLGVNFPIVTLTVDPWLTFVPFDGV